MTQVEGLDAPAIMRIGAARLTAGLDRMPRLDLEAHREIFGPLPRLSVEELISMTEQVEDRKSTRLNSSHITRSRMPSSA